MSLVEAVFHLKTCCIGPQENYTVDNFVNTLVCPILNIILVGIGRSLVIFEQNQKLLAL